jgi:hypothetical protein
MSVFLACAVLCILENKTLRFSKDNAVKINAWRHKVKKKKRNQQKKPIISQF